MTKVKPEKFHGSLDFIQMYTGKTFAVFASSVWKVLLKKAIADLNNFLNSSEICKNHETFLSINFYRQR